ncbi:MAG: molecular chaperone DnaJ [Methylococcus sp.]|nr:MAG: molecular chaperone DnaJ [Methylococcus sp.]
MARYSATQQSLIALGILLLLLLMFTGRLGFMVPLLGAVLAALFSILARVMPLVIPLVLQYLPHWQRYQQQRTRYQDLGGSPGSSQSGNTSTVQSAYLRMQLHHDTGELSGEILQGPQQGRQLRDLDLASLANLYQTYTQKDPESARLLAAYIERVHGDRWREAEQEQGHRSGPAGKSGLDQAEALEILGLEPGATRKDIIAAHRRLMQKVHPDRGGSDYLAAKINQAKDLLLGD